MLRIHGIRFLVALGVLALSFFTLAGCNDGPDMQESAFFGASNNPASGDSAFQMSPANDTSNPVFPVFESQASAAVQGGTDGDPVVACDVHIIGDQMRADAYWGHFPENGHGGDLSGYRYIWMIPGGLGTNNIDNKVGLYQQGTSLLDRAMPDNATLMLALMPLYGDNEITGDRIEIACTRIG